MLHVIEDKPLAPVSRRMKQNTNKGITTLMTDNLRARRRIRTIWVDVHRHLTRSTSPAEIYDVLKGAGHDLTSPLNIDTDDIIALLNNAFKV